jgi:hydroxylamine reductase
MSKYKCVVCEYVYDPKLGDPDDHVPPGTEFKNLSDNWVCPDCSLGKEYFEEI